MNALLQLDPGEMLAEANVGASSEADMTVLGIDGPVGFEAVWIGKRPRVPPGNADREEDHRVPGQQDATIEHVVGG